MAIIVLNFYHNPEEQVRIINKKAKEASKKIRRELIAKLVETEIEGYLTLNYAEEKSSHKTVCLYRLSGQRRANKSYQGDKENIGKRLAKEDVIVTDWRKLQMIGKAIRFKQSEEKINRERVIVQGEIYLRVRGERCAA